MTLDLAYAAAGALTGFVVGLTGVGGGAMMTPLLLLVFGVHPVTAIATDLWFATLTKLAGAIVHQRAGQVDWQVVRRLWAGSLPMAALVLLSMMLGHQHARLGWLTAGVAFVVLVTAAGLVLAPRLNAIARERRLAEPVAFKSRQRLLTNVAGAVLGLCVALTSVGAGALGTVMLLFLYPLRMTPHRLVATDIAHAIPLALVAGLGYLYLGQVDFHILPSLLAGSLPAIVLGSLVAKRLHGRWLQLLLALILAATGVKLLGA
jgi:hypothetical protein